MLTSAEYAASLRDGRSVWVLGDGPVEDVTTHPATQAVFSFYAEWYGRHHDPAWTDILHAEASGDQDRTPLAFKVPRTAADLRALGKAAYSTAFATAGNISHTPLYGALIAHGLVDALKGTNVQAARLHAAETFRAELARTGRFLTFSSGLGTLSDSFRPPGEGAGARVVRETAEGIVVRGVVPLHTATPFAHDVLVLAGNTTPLPAAKAWFAVPIGAHGVRVVARQSARRQGGRSTAPFSNRFDELDAALWLDDVLVPWDRVFALGSECNPIAGNSLIQWISWHQEVGWLARADFTLGLLLACAHAAGKQAIPATMDHIVDVVLEVQTIRSLLTAAELDPEMTKGGHILPGRLHLAPAVVRSIEMRTKLSEALRICCASSALLAPTEMDLEDPAIAAVFDEMFGAGGGYTVAQRAALLNAAWDHISSGLDGREHSYELFGSGGVPVWRNRLRVMFDRYAELANGVLAVLAIDVPALSFDHLRVPPQRPIKGVPTAQPGHGETKK